MRLRYKMKLLLQLADLLDKHEYYTSANYLSFLIKSAIKDPCRLCKDPTAYQGFSSTECTTLSCPNYSPSWVEELNKNKSTPKETIRHHANIYTQLSKNTKKELAVGGKYALLYCNDSMAMYDKYEVEVSHNFLENVVFAMYNHTNGYGRANFIIIDSTGNIVFNMGDIKALHQAFPLSIGAYRLTIQSLKQWLTDNNYI